MAPPKTKVFHEIVLKLRRHWFLSRRYIVKNIYKRKKIERESKQAIKKRKERKKGREGERKEVRGREGNE